MIEFTDDVTSLGADTFNAMQESLLQDMEEKLAIINGETLYENSSGTNATILLNENPLSYKRIEIDYLTDDGSHGKQYNRANIPIYELSTQFYNLISCYFGAAYWYTFEAYISINTDSIVFNTNRTYQQNINIPSGLARTDDAPIKITKVVGLSY